MTLHYPKEKRVQGSQPLIDPMDFRAKTDVKANEPGYPFALDDVNDEIPPKLHEWMNAYENELKAISTVKRPDGRPIFSGLGFYSELGADLLPLVRTRTQGRLVGMSLHESEVLVGCALLRIHGYNPNEVLGGYVNSGVIRRNVDEATSGIGSSKELDEVLTRLSGRGMIGRAIGSKKWRNQGRYINWEHHTFLPSASGDQTVLEDYLRGHKFDYLILKGTMAHGFNVGQSETLEHYDSWLKLLHERFLAKDAVVAVSTMDKPAVEFFRRYRIQET